MQLHGAITLPGDKSISHRVAMLNAIANGQATIRNYSPGADCVSTLRCLRALGAEIVPLGSDFPGTTSFTITGKCLQEPVGVLNTGNSGTTMRLLTGLLAGQPFLSVLTGDRSLRSRPMERVVMPLQLMGAQVYGRCGDSRAPLVVRGGRNLKGIEYTLPVASAQVKSAILLAGLYAEGGTVVHQPSLSRDHTERLLHAMGAPIQVDGATVRLNPGQLCPLDIAVPGDISAAAYWIVAGLCHPNARIRVCAVGVNPTRTGILDVLRSMGGHVALENQTTQAGEPVADVVVQSSELTGTEISGEMVPLLIDEVPVLALAACFARGTTVIRDAGELRVKESDRIRAIARELTRLGADISELPDGLVIRGTGKLRGATCHGCGDHRVAMTLGIAGLLAHGETVVLGAEVASISDPTFWQNFQPISHGTSESEL